MSKVKITLAIILAVVAIAVSCKTFSTEIIVKDNPKTKHSVMYKDGKRSSGYYSSQGVITYRDSNGRVVQRCTIKGNVKTCRE